MRKLLYPLLFIVIILQVLAYLAYTASGNDMILPYLNHYLSQNSNELKIRLTKLRLHPGKIAFVAKINNDIDMVAKGDLSLLTQAFDLKYVIDADKIQTEGLSIEEHVKLKGKAAGEPNDMQIFGKGDAFGSRINYTLQLIDKKPKNITLDMGRANLKNILIVSGHKPYASGLLSLHINMPKLNPKNPSGTAKLKIEKGVLNSQLIKKEFDIEIPPKTKLSMLIKAKAIKKHISANGLLKTSIGNIDFDGGLYALATKNIYTNYKLQVADMNKLKSLTGTSLTGKMLVTGSISQKHGVLAIDGKSNSFSGNTSFEYENNKLKAKLVDVTPEILLAKLGQPKYLLGKLNATINFDSLADKSGTITASSIGELDTKVVKKNFDINLGDKFALNSGLKAKINNKLIAANFVVKSNMATLKGINLQYDTSTTAMAMNYALAIPDLQMIKALTNDDYRGQLNIVGNIKKGKDLLIKGKTSDLGGETEFELINDILTAQAKDASAKKVAYMLNYPQIFEANIQADLLYNTSVQKGQVEATLNNARMLPSQLTVVVKNTLGENLEAENFNSTELLAHLNKKFIDFNIDAHSTESYIVIKDARITKKSKHIDAKLDMKLHGKDIQAGISGNINRPKVKLEGSSYLVKRVKEKVLEQKEVKKIKKKIQQETGNLQEKLNEELSKKHGDKIKSLIDRLF